MYLNIANIRFKEECAYRLELLAGIFGSVTLLVVLWFVWNAVYASAGVESIGGLTLSTMITYITISVILRTYGYPFTEFLIEEHVKTGAITNLLIKPITYPISIFSLDFGSTAFALLTKALPIFLVAFLFLGVSLPLSPLAFLISVGFGYFINYFMIFLTGMWAFWTSGSVWGLRLARHIVSDILSGALIPIYLFPEWLGNIANLLPFQAVYHIPLSIYIGKIEGFEILNALAQQVFWFFVLFLVCYFVWKRAESKIIVQGG